jgi:hypothetical protein
MKWLSPRLKNSYGLARVRTRAANSWMEYCTEPSRGGAHQNPTKFPSPSLAHAGTQSHKPSRAVTRRLLARIYPDLVASCAYRDTCHCPVRLQEPVKRHGGGEACR